MKRPRLLAPALAATLLLPACGSDTPVGRDALAVGWSARFDDAGAQPEPMRFVETADGLEVTPGPNATLWHPDQRASGSYRLSAEVTHLDSGLHPHGAGLVFGGTDVAGDGQSYTYFLVRGDGRFLIKARNGAETASVVAWTEHEAVAAEGRDRVANNRLTVEVGGEQTRFLVNGTEVHRAATSGLPTDGMYGFRLVHDLHVRFGKPRLEALDG